MTQLSLLVPSLHMSEKKVVDEATDRNILKRWVSFFVWCFPTIIKLSNANILSEITPEVWVLKKMYVV